MMHIPFDLIKLLNLVPPQEEKIEDAPPLQMKYYVHFNEKTLEIKAVTCLSTPSEGEAALEISEDLGLKFLRGTENVLRYTIIALKKDKFDLVLKSDKIKAISDRVDVVETIYEVDREWTKDPEVWFEILEDENIVLVYFDGEKFPGKVAKFYFTRYDDPSYLKFTFTLDVNILNKITYDNQLPEWPNPIPLKVDDATDISIYGIRNQPHAMVK